MPGTSASVASPTRADFKAAATEVLSALAADHKNAYRTYVVALGASISLGAMFYGHIELAAPGQRGEDKPKLHRLARQLLATDHAERLFASSSGPLELDVEGTADSFDLGQPPRHFYAFQSVPKLVAHEHKRPHVLVWCLTNERSTTPYGPRIGRTALDRLEGILVAKSTKPSSQSLARAVRGGAVVSALEILCALHSFDAAILWYYNNDQASFISLASVGVADRRLNVPIARGNPERRIGIVSQSRPDRHLVVYDAKDRTVWAPPHAGEWKPFDEGIFSQKSWRSAVSIPIALEGKILGAVTVYSAQPASVLVRRARDAQGSAYLFAGHILATREERVIADLVDKYDDELLRANVSLSALSLSHDLFHYYKSIASSIANALAYQQTRQTGRVVEELHEVEDSLRRADPILSAMQKLAKEARSSDETPDPDQLSDVAGVLTGMESLLRSILPMVSKGNVLDEDGVEIAITGTPAPVRISSMALERIVLNLCVNAAQWRATEILVEARFTSGRVSLVVRDNGKGIRKEDRERVFDRFFSGRSGSGLGLYVVRSLAMAAGGQVLLQSHDQDDSIDFRGTTVTVIFPTT